MGGCVSVSFSVRRAFLSVVPFVLSFATSWGEASPYHRRTARCLAWEGHWSSGWLRTRDGVSRSLPGAPTVEKGNIFLRVLCCCVFCAKPFDSGKVGSLKQGAIASLGKVHQGPVQLGHHSKSDPPEYPSDHGWYGGPTYATSHAGAIHCQGGCWGASPMLPLHEDGEAKSFWRRRLLPDDQGKYGARSPGERGAPQ